MAPKTYLIREIKQYTRQEHGILIHKLFLKHLISLSGSKLVKKRQSFAPLTDEVVLSNGADDLLCKRS